MAARPNILSSACARTPRTLIILGTRKRACFLSCLGPTLPLAYLSRRMLKHSKTLVDEEDYKFFLGSIETIAQLHPTRYTHLPTGIDDKLSLPSHLLRFPLSILLPYFFASAVLFTALSFSSRDPFKQSP
ncbi:hypothetical protein BDY19DRAFT_998666 [Irpex rosettiformis]|uniref:Uncharacterized protein n=1 Tax=Irpex rosettiformis TaxID=378272 RepID=A0ACB8TMU0_9APHY|nr:hypothetical protein BDY19DRAFT_998666 [Irpex rosettiformis]